MNAAQQKILERARQRLSGQSVGIYDEDEDETNTFSASQQSILDAARERLGASRISQSDAPTGLGGGIYNAARRGLSNLAGIPDVVAAEDLSRTADYEQDRADRDARGELPLWERILTAQLNREDPAQLRAQAADAAKRRVDRYDRSRAAFPMSEAGSAAIQDISEGGLLEGLGKAVRNPLATGLGMVEVAAEQAPSILAAAGTTALTRSPTLGVAAMGGSTYAQERYGQLLNDAAEAGYDLRDPAQAQAAVQDKAFMDAQAEKGRTRGLIIGTVDLFTAGLASKTPLSLAGVGKNTGIQTVGGGSGEAAAQVASGEEIQGGEVLIEALAEGVTAPVDVAALGLRTGGRFREQPTQSQTNLKSNLAQQLAEEDAELQSRALAEQKEAEKQVEALDDAVYEVRAEAAKTFTPEDEFIAERKKARDTQNKAAIADPQTELGAAFKNFLKSQRDAGKAPIYGGKKLEAAQKEFLKNYDKGSQERYDAEDLAAYEQALDLHAQQIADGTITPEVEAEAPATDTSESVQETTPTAVDPMTLPVRKRTDAIKQLEALVQDGSLPPNWAEQNNDLNGAVNGERFQIKPYKEALDKVLNPVEEPATEAETEVAPVNAPLNNEQLRQSLKPQQVKVYDALLAAVDDKATGNLISVEWKSGEKKNETRGWAVEVDNKALAKLSGIENPNSAKTAVSGFLRAFNDTFSGAQVREALIQADALNTEAETLTAEEGQQFAAGMGGDGTLNTVGTAGGTQTEGASANQSAKKKAEETKRFKDAGMTDEQIAAFYDPQREADTAEAELAGQVLEDVENARYAVENADRLLRTQWAASSAEGGPSYDDLSMNNKIDWMETVYATLGQDDQSRVLSAKAESIRGITDATGQDNESGRTEVQEPSGEETGAQLSEDTGRRTETDAEPAASDGEGFTAGQQKTAVVEKKKTRKLVKKPRMSLEEAEASANGTTANNLRDAIKWFVGKDANWRTTVVNDPSDLIGLVLSKQLNIDGMTLGEILDASSAQGTVVTDNDGVDRAFFFANNISAGNERAVIAHELGGHIGIDNVLTREQHDAAANKIREWATSEGTSLEKAISERALSRASSAKLRLDQARMKRDFPSMQLTAEQETNFRSFVDEATRSGGYNNTEVIAYFLEEAVKAGITPNSDSKSDLVSFIRQLWSDFKRALRRLRPDNEPALSAVDLVNMARGAARLELATDFHGTSKAFRKVSPDYMGLGANAFGVGFYITEDYGTGVQYMMTRMDERRVDEGSLQRVDTTVADEEYLNWTELLSEQPAVLEKLEQLPEDIKLDVEAEMGDRSLENAKGRQLYLALTALQLREYSIEEFIGQDAYDKANQLDKEVATAMSIVSSYLDSIGVKGAKVEIDPTDTSNSGPLFNKIIFNADNAIVVGSSEAAEVGPTRTSTGTIKFSVPESETDNQTSYVRKNFGDGAAEALTNLKKISRQPLDATKNLDRLIRENEAKMPSARKWFDFMLAAEATRNEVLSMVESVMNQARPISMERKELVNDFLGSSTFYQKWGYDPQWVDRKTGEPIEVEIDPTMKKKYDRLTDEEKQLVRDIFAHGRTIQELMQGVAEQLGVSKFFNLSSKLKGPYAPLKRFGDQVAELKSQELLDAEAAKERDPSKENRKAVEKLKSDGDHYVVSFFDSPGAAETFVLANKDKYAYAEYSEKAVSYEDSREGGARAYEKILGAVNANLAGLDQDSKNAMAKLVRDMYFQTLDDSNARLAGTKRLNRAGYDKDMLRSFAVHGMAQANLVAQMKHGADISAALVDAYKEAKKTPRALLPVYNKIALKFQRTMAPRTGMLADLETNVMKFNSFYMLTSSLGYFFQNMTQPYFAAANIAGEFGWKQAQTWGKLFSGYGVAKKVINTSFLNQIKNVASVGLLGGNSTVELNIDQAAPELRPLLKDLQMRGLLDVGITEDLRHVNMSPNVAVRAYDEMTHRLYQSARYVEANNRIASAVAAFKMAQQNPQKMKRLKMTPKEFAIRIVQDTQGNFSQLDAPAAFDVLFKAPLQFRKYQFQMGWLHIDAAKQAFKGADPETKKAGFRKLSLMLGYTGVLGGLASVPMANVASSLVQATIAGLSGEDEENPPKSLERWIRENVEDERTATLLTRGVPAALGWDFSQKLDQSDLFMPYNSKYVDLDPSRDGALLFAAQLFFGPSGTVVGNMGNVADFINRGNYYRAAEYAMPKGLRSYFETLRFAGEGYTTRGELTITDPTKFDAVDFLTNAIGLPSTDVNQIKWTRGQQVEIEQWFSKETSRIKRGYLSAYDDRDREAMAKYRDEFRELQKAKDRVRPFFNNSRNVLKRASVSDLVKAPRARAREQRRLDSVTGN